MTEHAVVIAGGGPTGLMLAGELALAGIDVAIVERRASRVVDGARAGGLHSRTIEVVEQRGIAEGDMDEPEMGVRRGGGGIGPVNREEGGGPFGVVLKEARIETAEPTLPDLRAALVAAYGTDFGARNPTRIARFTDMARQAA